MKGQEKTKVCLYFMFQLMPCQKKSKYPKHDFSLPIPQWPALINSNYPCRCCVIKGPHGGSDLFLSSSINNTSLAQFLQSHIHCYFDVWWLMTVSSGQKCDFYGEWSLITYQLYFARVMKVNYSLFEALKKWSLSACQHGANNLVSEMTTLTLSTCSSVELCIQSFSFH